MACLPARWNHITDLDGDGSAEAIATLELRRGVSREFGSERRAFNADGSVRWAEKPDDRLVFGGQEFGPPWPAADLGVYTSGSATRITWALHHFTWWPSLLVVMDGSGNRLGAFVNAGWVRAGVPSIDARHLAVIGTNNSRQAPFVAVLDAANPSGRSPEPAGSEMECLSCPDGDPLEYYVLPRTDVSQHQPFPADGPTVMTFVDATVQVHALERGGPNIATVIYDLTRRSEGNGTPTYSVTGARFADSFWEWHRRLEQEGRITHPSADCPHRRGLEVQRWTPSTGWTGIAVPVR